MIYAIVNQYIIYLYKYIELDTQLVVRLRRTMCIDSKSVVYFYD